MHSKTRTLAWLALALAATPAAAQTLRGTVRDAATGEPVVLAYVGLLAEGRDLVVAHLADAGGAFAVEAPAPGSYFIYVARSGYETLMDGVFELGPDGVLELQIGLTPEPIELDPVEVEATASMSPLERVGFYQRALDAPGHFMIRDDFERASVSRLTDAFRGLPRVRVDARRPLVGPGVMQTPAVQMRRGADICNPTLYIDHHVVETGVAGPVRPDEYVSPSDVEGVEIYERATEVPVGFDPINDCGIIVIWTRVR